MLSIKFIRASGSVAIENVRETGARNGEIGVIIGQSVTDIGSRQRKVFQVQFAQSQAAILFMAAPRHQKGR
jgi:hypothetical protein